MKTIILPPNTHVLKNNQTLHVNHNFSTLNNHSSTGCDPILFNNVETDKPLNFAISILCVLI